MSTQSNKISMIIIFVEVCVLCLISNNQQHYNTLWANKIIKIPAKGIWFIYIYTFVARGQTINFLVVVCAWILSSGCVSLNHFTTTVGSTPAFHPYRLPNWSTGVFENMWACKYLGKLKTHSLNRIAQLSRYNYPSSAYIFNLADAKKLKKK